MSNMTDKQMEVIVDLIADRFGNCKDMDEVRRTVEEVKRMVRKEKPDYKVKENLWKE